MGMSVVRHWFAQPWALALLGLIPVLGVAAVLALRRRRRLLGRWGSRHALEALVSVRRRRRSLRTLGRVMGFSLLGLAIAGPQWGRDCDPATAKGRDVVVLLDLSRSMLAQDVLGRSSPDRLGRARDALLDLVQMIERRGGHRLALVIFAARAQVLCPLTHDYDHFRDTLINLDPADALLDIGPGPNGSPSGTRMGIGLIQAVETHDPRAHGHQDILMISDGDDPARDDEWQQGIAAACQQGIVVHTIGVGDPDLGSPIPVAGERQLLYQGKPVLTRLVEKPLQEIARQTRGTYTAARTQALPLGEIFRERMESSPGRENSDDVLPVYRQHPFWFFAAALTMLAFEMTFSDHRPRAVPKNRDIQ
jgi:Ca-activated chloride channel family protein